MITAHHLVFGRKYGGYFLYPFTNTKLVELSISTRSGNIKIDKGDGSAIYALSPNKNYDFTTQSFSAFNIKYTNPYTGNLKVITDLGNADVYSIAFSWVRDSPEYQNKYNIPVLEDFFAQFPNLYSIYFEVYAYGQYGYSLFAGNFAKLPNSVERVKINQLQCSGNRIINFNDYSLNSKLKYFEALNDVPRLTGDLKLPPLCTFFKGTFPSSSTLTYTSGKTWPSSFDTLDLGNASLSYTETDNLLIDMANSITTAIGSKVIRLANCNRTYASDTAVAYLQSLGFTITVARIAIIASNILDFDVANPSSYIGSGTTIYDLSGYNNNGTLLNGVGFNPDSGGSLVFDGVDDSISIADNLNLRSLDGTFSIWVKQVNDTSPYSAVASKISGGGSFNGWLIYVNSTSVVVSIKNASIAYELKYSINTSVWVNITLVWISSTTWKLYVNGVLRQTITTAPVTISNQPLYLGKSLDKFWYTLKGRIGLVKSYNYNQSDGEVLTEFNNNKTRFGL